ncbi:camphor resistance protein CrcB [Thermosulfidibacter takaii ABI70S6]|uniref:Fluoride-specific ion channel FluC n=1 Tax=Thermosulfidibacter takaii (strain DSM 17441 / JCM 13301 / NBRC 103674 / ABI70S6) TaxID=1298851 RepID=A0A0S3QTA9_THET7|nr:CrcB family protein [Thermosulfidibacter takaii]BAT71555.1 camphor resistance protein CrcB [Thermosulfidibacter takaii ABI70S6]
MSCVISLPMWLEWVLIFLFGGLGCLARYAISGVALRILGPYFPYSTLTVNVLGSFGLTLFMELALSVLTLNPMIRTAVAVGIFGGFTTFSSFSYETVKLFEEGSLLLAGLNIMLNVILCIVAAFIGFYVARRIAY